MPISRRQFIQLGAQAAALAAAGPFRIADAQPRESSAFAPIHAKLDAFVEQYLRDMHAPGMTLVLADREGVQRVVTYGFGDPALGTPIPDDALFQIGSISKSFVANSLLQLRDEGRLDLHRRLLDYLPGLRIDEAFGPITIHHLLTHASGLPGNPPLFLSDPQAKHRAAYPPGQHFHYSNTAFEALGLLLSSLDRRPIGESIRRRVFEPLGMTRSEPVISFDVADRIAKSWWSAIGDRPFPREGRLAEAPAIVSTDGAGCVLSTAHDMGLYVRMLARRGAGKERALLSGEGFGLFSTPHIRADEFGPTASYGYGIVVDKLDGRRILRHTGGMVSFASAIEVDLDEGVGAFASINAMQGYRPMPVVEYANRLMHASRKRNTLPPTPARNDPAIVGNAAGFAGVYRDAHGESLAIVAADGPRLFLEHAGERIALEAGDAGLLALHPRFSRFPLMFSRANPKDPKSPIVELHWGESWYANERYAGPSAFASPPEWQAWVGHYRNENPWVGSLRIVALKGVLTIDGVVPLAPDGDGRFVLRDEAHSPEWVRFDDIVDGKAMRLKFSGEDLWRVMTP